MQNPPESPASPASSERPARFALRATGRAALVLACCLLLTALATALSVRTIDARRAAAVASAVDAQMANLDTRVAAYVALLRATRAFVIAQGDALEGTRFAAFVASLRIPVDYPGIQGIGWSPRVGPGPNDFRIDYLEPLDARNRAALHFNMHSERMRADAMDRARDEGVYAITGAVVLKQEIDPEVSPGFLIYLPLYAGGAVPATVDERRRTLRGFVYAPFRAPDFFPSAVREDGSVALRSIVSRGPAGESGVLFGHVVPASRSIVARDFAIGGRTWSLQFEPVSAISWAERLQTVVVLVAGLLISGLVFELSRTQARARRRAEERSIAMARRMQFSQLLVGIVSHDLRNPLNVIQLNAGMLERAQLPDTFARCVQRIQASSALSIRMVRDLLDFTQARLAGGIPVVRTQGDIAQIVQQAVDEAKLAHPQREIELDVQGDGVGTWDADRIGQVVSNLVNNALVYGSANSPVRVMLACGKSRVELCVHNEGDPIPPELLAALFEPLQQGESRAGVARRNIGLGLFIVQQIVVAHGGTVRCESNDIDGTRFIVNMPRVAH